MNTENGSKPKGAWLTVVVFTTLSVSLVAYALYLYFAIGAGPPRPWHFGAIQDVPGASRYSISRTGPFFFTATSPEKQGVVARQHVMEGHGAPAVAGDSGDGNTGDNPE